MSIRIDAYMKATDSRTFENASLNQDLTYGSLNLYVCKVVMLPLYYFTLCLVSKAVCTELTEHLFNRQLHQNLFLPFFNAEFYRIKAALSLLYYTLLGKFLYVAMDIV